MELLKSLNKKFIEGYSKLAAELNKNIYPAALDNGTYEAPVITVGPGGGTANPIDDKLKPPAQVSVELRKVEPFSIIYRLAIPRNECEIADKNPAYFKYLFDKVLEKGLSNYKSTVGGPEILRFGTQYVKLELLNILDGADNLELRISGNWASDKSVE